MTDLECRGVGLVMSSDPSGTVGPFIVGEPQKTFGRNGLIEASHDGVHPNFSVRGQVPTNPL
jgi:hypothetical protein